MFKSGKIGLFDTKTRRADLEAPNKHNALIEYLEKQNEINTDRILVGGILIPEETSGIVSFRYCNNRISDTNDLTGWDFFNPANINTN
jgi:type III restriction enzyme